ncbi:hypothetical protein CYMTET_23746 [Cymbomonas tetramitiformis]|uniref:Uncharacterized protein n=1 Tax=Cymbomonas tetramitiformis TaxID=36881 RepID=A0AAE0FXA6_9CHLO|nr:hypothetical protein CYMTET_23746 [Cymbomonas tetramitiformis]
MYLLFRSLGLSELAGSTSSVQAHSPRHNIYVGPRGALRVYAKTPATPGLAITSAARKSIRLLRKEGFENTVAKNVLSSVLGAKDARFTAGEKHADLIWLHLVEAIEKHFVNEFDTFVDLFRLTDPTVECSEDANDLLYVTLEHLIKPGDGKRALLEISRRLDDQTEPLDALKALIDHRFEANVDPDAGIRRFNEFVADAAHQLGVPLNPGVVKKHFLASLDSDFFSAMRAEYRRVDQRHSVDILDLQSRLREEFKSLTKDFKKKTAMTVPLAAAYYENDRGRGDDHGKSNCGAGKISYRNWPAAGRTGRLLAEMRKELSAVRQEIKDLKGGQGQGQGEHDRRTFFEKNFVDARHDRGRGQRGKGKGKGKGAFYRVGAKSGVDSAVHNAFDEEDDETFAELCDHYGKAEYSGLREISAVNFTVDPALGARSVVFEDSNATAAPPRVAFTAEKPEKIVPAVHAKPTVVHNDERALGSFDKWANYVSPVLDMTPTVSAHFDKFTLTVDPFDETENEDACDSEDEAQTAAVVSVLPSRADVEAKRLRDNADGYRRA